MVEGVLLFSLLRCGSRQWNERKDAVEEVAFFTHLRKQLENVGILN